MDNLCGMVSTFIIISLFDWQLRYLKTVELSLLTEILWSYLFTLIAISSLPRGHYSLNSKVSLMRNIQGEHDALHDPQSHGPLLSRITASLTLMPTMLRCDLRLCVCYATRWGMQCATLFIFSCAWAVIGCDWWVEKARVLLWWCTVPTLRFHSLCPLLLNRLISPVSVFTNLLWTSRRLIRQAPYMYKWFLDEHSASFTFNLPTARCVVLAYCRDYVFSYFCETTAWRFVLLSCLIVKPCNHPSISRAHCTCPRSI